MDRFDSRTRAFGGSLGVKRFLLMILSLAFGLHWLQSWQRCQRADQRSKDARQELSRFEDSLKEWPELQARAMRLQAPRLRQPEQLKHRTDLQLSFREEPQGFYRMRVRGPRGSVVEELLSLNRYFWVKQLDLELMAGDQISGSVLLLGIP